jgi:hypothetical protein
MLRPSSCNYACLSVYSFPFQFKRQRFSERQFAVVFGFEPNRMRPCLPPCTILPLLLFLLVLPNFATALPLGLSHVVRSVFPSFRTFPCPSPPSISWSRPAAAAMFDWSRAATGTAVVVTFDGHYLETFQATSGELAVILLPSAKMTQECVAIHPALPFAVAWFHTSAILYFGRVAA